MPVRLAISILCLYAAVLSRPAKAADRAESIPSDVQSLIDAARAAPPEFGADAMLSLVESGLLPNGKAKRELLEEAFDIASGAQEKVALEWPGTGSVSEAMTQLSWKGIDQVSLRARAARAMLDVDPAAARELFERIVLPLDTTFSCEKPFYFKLSIYYAVLPKIWQSISLPAERTSFLTGQIARFHSVAQIWPFGGALAEIAAKGGTDEMPLYLFASRLPQLDHDGRILSGEIRGAIFALKRLADMSGPGAREHIVQQSREWILQASRRGYCMDRPARVLSKDGKITRRDPVAPIDLFNSDLAPLGKDKPVIDAKDTGGALPGPIWENAGYSAAYLRFDQMRRLLAQDQAEDKVTARWHIEIEKYITLVTDWSPDGDGDPTAFYLEKADLLHRILKLKKDAPGEPAAPSDFRYWEARRVAPEARFLGRDRVAAALINLYEGAVATEVYNKRRCLWLEPVRRLAVSAGNNPAITGLLMGSKDPVLHLYGLLAKLESAAGRANF